MSSQEAYAEFHAYSLSIAADFLQSVVVVDDKAETDPKTKPGAAEATPTSVLTSPSRGGQKVSTLSKTPAETTDQIIKGEDKEKLHSVLVPTEPASPIPNLLDEEVLPIKALNEAFAQHGIVCGFLRPPVAEAGKAEIIDRVEKTAKRADIVILDWKMEVGDAPGRTALTIIDRILLSDDGKRNNLFQSSGRLRLIVIYTQSLDLIKIRDAIYDHLNAGSPSVFKKLGDYELGHESTRICVFRKSGGTTKAADGRTYDVIALTDKIIDEFTLLTEGLLSNVAIEAMTALRQNTHKVLQKFNPSLDAPYLTHRALTNPVEETQSHPVALIASEMQDVLEGNGVTESIAPEQIEFWIKGLSTKVKLKSDFRDMSAEQLPDFVLDAVVKGVHDESVYTTPNAAWNAFMKKMKASERDKASRFTNTMLSDDTGKDKDRDFSMLTTIRSHYNEPPPYLTLGSIVAVRNGKASDYYVCIQPVCDCVRLTCARRFPFLKLIPLPVPEPEKPKFDIVIKDKGEFCELKVDVKPYNMELFTFTPKAELIRAEKREGEIQEWVFKGINALGEPVDYIWIADLKFAHAQRIAGRFAVEVSRVGLTESEWLRRMAS
ncbi:response regulator receiver domain [Hymenobacter rubidus]|uniref:response regulator receiver domain n=1 Tax=Hymenobacter rubidus TaxID=1441626 RepID=UPI00191FC759|nr:response regulator receiver domain [Hymenobacter rubidus]